MGVCGRHRHPIGELGERTRQAKDNNESHKPPDPFYRAHFFLISPKDSSSRFICVWMRFFSTSVKFSPEIPDLRIVRILPRTLDRLRPKIRQRSGVFSFSIQRSLASCAKSVLTPFHRTSTHLIASGCSSTCRSPPPNDKSVGFRTEDKVAKTQTNGFNGLRDQ